MPAFAKSRGFRPAKRLCRRQRSPPRSSASRRRSPMTKRRVPNSNGFRLDASRGRPRWIPTTTLDFEPIVRTKHTFRLPPELAGDLADFATRKRVPQALVVETALASYLSPDGSERMEAAFGRRLDRLTRQMERVERHVTISNEALALFVRFWLTVTPPLPDTAQSAAQAKRHERYEGFVEALGRRLSKGQTLAQEISRDVIPKNGTSDQTGGSF